MSIIFCTFVTVKIIRLQITKDSFVILETKIQMIINKYLIMIINTNSLLAVALFFCGIIIYGTPAREKTKCIMIEKGK